MNILRSKALILLMMLAPLSAAHAIKVSYIYDAAGRLTAVNYNGTSRTAFGYDKNGNMLSRTNTVTPPTHPAIVLAANYVGLVDNASPNAVNVAPITLKLMNTGTFSGKATIEGVAYPIAGTFAADGTTPAINFARKPAPGTYTLTLSLDVAGGTRQVTGTLTSNGLAGGDFASTVLLDRSNYNTTTQLLPAGLAGNYTAIFLPGENTVTVPQGDGYATVKITSSGGITAAGKLADGTAITHSSTLIGDAVWPVFISFYKTGYIYGRVVFASIPGASDFSGPMTWLKPATTGPLYPGQFFTKPTLLGSKYDVPATNQRALAFLNKVPNAIFTASGASLQVDPLMRDITLDIKNKFITPVDAAKLKLTLTTPSGAISGSFVDGTATRTLGGVIFQEQNIASGFFANPDIAVKRTGPIQIEAKP